MVKTCAKCKIEKPLTEFSKNKSTRNGYRSECKSCSKKYRKANAERIKQYNKKYIFIVFDIVYFKYFKLQDIKI